ncbi:MAG: ATP-binding protein [Eggerthellaceae bacterium]|nr:ATP-binding protein [Eggerthellaceae bacterium]
MFVAREKELELLREAAASDGPQFIAVYGRRRVGKTSLIREAFGDSFTFQHSGMASGNKAEQLYAFGSSMSESGLGKFGKPSSWLEAFDLLKDVVKRSRHGKKIVFIDELSWMDTPKSGFVSALEWFWNGWASARKDVVLVVCASATSWMLDKVVHNKGGLYNRLTRQVHLKPFTLRECEALAKANGMEMNRHQILECYMVMGGVPYYWNLMRRNMSLSQNIDALFFSEDAPLAREYDYLFSSLFKHPRDYVQIIEALSGRKSGMLREEIAAAMGATSSGTLTKRLEELESCGFIRKYRAYGKKSRDSLYQLIDNFTLFHRKFLTDADYDEHRWSNLLNTPARNAWCGLAFERVCLEHVPQIKAALGISGVQTSVNSWACKRDDDLGVEGSQIDLLIARRDQVINVCEMKFSTDEYVLTKAADRNLRNKVRDFQVVTKSKSAIHPVLVTTYGLKRNAYSNAFLAVVTAEDLFA